MCNSAGGDFAGLRRWLSLTALLLSFWALPGCALLEYTPWGQAKASQKRVASQRMPSELLREPAGTVLPHGDAPNARVARLRIRAYATPRYAGALVDGRAQLEQALSDANPTLAHDFSFRLELADYRVWQTNLPDDDLGALVSALQKEDPAEDVDWVVVLASPRRMVALSADQIGLAPLLGRHFAIRAMSDADEFDVIERGFSELSEAEKARLYAARKRHKSATVLLHELGHTLAIPHELELHSLMSPQYSPQASAFSASAARLGRRALELRATTPGTELMRNTAQAALNVLRGAPAHTWEAGSARDAERLLEAWSQLGAPRARPVGLPAASTASPAALLPKPPSPRAPSPPKVAQKPLSDEDRALLLQAKEAQAAGRIAEARRLGAPLFVAYPDDYTIQDFRCDLALSAGLPSDARTAECEPLRRLSGSSF